MLQFPDMPVPDDGHDNTPAEAGPIVDTESVTNPKPDNIVDIGTRRKRRPPEYFDSIDDLSSLLESAGLLGYSHQMKELEVLVSQVGASRRMRLLAQYGGLVAKYENIDIESWLKKDKSEWVAKPIFFYAIFKEAQKRGLLI